MQTQVPIEDSATPEHSTAQPRNPAGPETGMKAERVYDGERERLQRALERDWLARQHPSEIVRLPNGETVRVQPGMPFKYPGDVTHPMFDHPGGIWKRVDGYWRMQLDESGQTTSILADPKPPFDFNGIDSHRYGWFVRTPSYKDDQRPQETAMLHRSNRIRYIEVSEVDKHSPIAIFEEYATPNNVYVTSGTIILAEIMDPRLSYQKYKGWDDLAIDRVKTMPVTVATAPSVPTDGGSLRTHIQNKTEIRYTEFGAKPRFVGEEPP